MTFEDPDTVAHLITAEVSRALQVLAPLKTSIVKDRSVPLKLAKDTLAAMAARDRAAKSGNTASFRSLRNRAACLCKRDARQSAREALARAKRDPKKVWALANAITGRRASAG